MDTVKTLLAEDRIPHAWYNLVPDLPFPLPAPIHPATGKPIVADDLLSIFPLSLIKQEMSQERWIEYAAHPIEAIQAALKDLP